ncbi:cryptochrome/photolyase family protein [Campylobacter pinnipediorum]|uniref:Deoxyribodipyrimidine photolyase n=1 Tax=Campylobacter pinnipediorum subsp. pinnipediorum TaxID=1660067 RepID=A0AAX0LA64_9BACT|nr:deoxyribodipyrimidine photo-lyase [Campylobacter pinnipediorum]AQW82837.1 deoxyribodipyrimidine photolyase [Campylobacter pinnipediorum subsp. pinnipediorum]OPA78004.1 deoxyribodipyrimidine photolyase [Campylobacter pinnipediorum subsp. pinnipediorum]OPA78168.1 deoxyribodipyrimidine photolyase [Campylobacter pinnipediorum subsp. pinnipediorum]
MKQILWFRRDLRVSDNAILANANKDVLPIFIFDKNILEKLPNDDKRVTFIYKSVLNLKTNLKKLGLDLAIFYDSPKRVFTKLKKDGFDEILCSIDFDSYSVNRDKEIEEILPLNRYLDSFILNPNEHLKKDQTPYKVFTPFYKSLNPITSSSKISTYELKNKLNKINFDYSFIPSLEMMGFVEQKLPDFLEKNPIELLDIFKEKIEKYDKARDYFYMDDTSKISVHLRFGLISPKEVFNYLKSEQNLNSESFIRELFWREFYNYILFHFPSSQTQNFQNININWSNNEEHFKKWCRGETGVPIIDAAMRHLNNTGTMHNRLRMITASFLTKNLFIDWKKGEEYFALKLLDYEASSNIGSWQWSASTGTDANPYFRVFNPYSQSKKFDPNAIFIKKVIPELRDVNPKLLHIENGLLEDIFIKYPASIVDITNSRRQAIQNFKKAKN